MVWPGLWRLGAWSGYTSFNSLAEGPWDSEIFFPSHCLQDMVQWFPRGVPGGQGLHELVTGVWELF